MLPQFSGSRFFLQYPVIRKNSHEGSTVTGRKSRTGNIAAAAHAEGDIYQSSSLSTDRVNCFTAVLPSLSLTIIRTS